MSHWGTKREGARSYRATKQAGRSNTAPGFMTNDPSAQVTQLHKLACQPRYFPRNDHTLNTTAPMHEAYLKLVKQPLLGKRHRDRFTNKSPA